MSTPDIPLDAYPMTLEEMVVLLERLERYERLLALRDQDVTERKCPRCGGPIPDDQHPGEHPGAISRVDNKTEICAACGVNEARYAILYRDKPLPPVDEEVWQPSR